MQGNSYFIFLANDGWKSEISPKTCYFEVDLVWPDYTQLFDFGKTI